MAAVKEMMWFLLLDEVCDDTIEHFLISDSNSDDGVLALVAHKQRKRRVRVENYAEIIVPQYSLDTFRSHFRMSRRALEFLEGLLAVLPGLPHEPKHTPYTTLQANPSYFMGFRQSRESKICRRSI